LDVKHVLNQAITQVEQQPQAQWSEQ
jgi:hypothetical protein